MEHHQFQNHSKKTHIISFLSIHPIFAMSNPSSSTQKSEHTLLKVIDTSFIPSGSENNYFPLQNFLLFPHSREFNSQKMKTLDNPIPKENITDPKSEPKTTNKERNIKVDSSKNLIPVEESQIEFLKNLISVIASQVYKSNDPISDQPVPYRQDLDPSIKTLSPDNSESFNKSRSTFLDKTLFKDLLTSREPSSNIQAISNEIEVHGLTMLCVEPPIWETPTTIFSPGGKMIFPQKLIRRMLYFLPCLIF